jgi:hypothetical protein
MNKPLASIMLTVPLLFCASALWAESSSRSSPPPSNTTVPAENQLPIERVDFGRLIQDVQKIDASAGKFQMATWLPAEFWDVSLLLSGASLDTADTRKARRLLDKYVIVMALIAEAPGPTIDRFASQEEIASLLMIEDDKGNRYEPLSDDEVDPDILRLLESVKPTLRDTAGKLGQGLCFVVFPKTSASGGRIPRGTDKGRLTLMFGDKRFEYRLPLGSLLKPKRDPATGEEFSGSFDFNPYTGARLEAAPATK